MSVQQLLRFVQSVPNRTREIICPAGDMSGDRAQNQAAAVDESSVVCQIKTSLQFPFMRNITSSVSDVTEQLMGDITPSWHHPEMFVLNYVSEFQPSDNSVAVTWKPRRNT